MKKLLSAVLAFVVVAGSFSLSACTGATGSGNLNAGVENSSENVSEDTVAADVSVSEGSKENIANYKVELTRHTQGTDRLATIVCKDGDNIVWEYNTEKYPITELEPISDVYEDAEKVYFSEGGNLIALEKATGNVAWRLDEALGYSAQIIMDDKNLYVTCYYGPNVAIFTKDGNELYRDNDESYYWVDRLELDGNTLHIYYYGSLDMEIGDEPAVKDLDITPYL